MANEIAERAVATANLKTEQMRKAEFMLKIPRLHDDYIHRYGVDPFVDKMTEIVSDHKMAQDRK